MSRSFNIIRKKTAAAKLPPLDVLESGGLPDDLPDQAGGHSPDGPALPVPDGDFHPAMAPGIVPGDAHGLIGKVLRHLGEELIPPDLRFRLLEEGQRDGENLRHLRGGGPHGLVSRRRHQPQHGPEEKAPGIADEIRLEEENCRLVDLQTENERKKSDARAYDSEALLKTFAGVDKEIVKALAISGMDSRALIARAFLEMGDKAGRIGTLNVSPDLLNALT